MIMNYYYRMSINLLIIWQKHWIHKKKSRKKYSEPFGKRGGGWVVENISLISALITIMTKPSYSHCHTNIIFLACHEKIQI